MDEFRNDGSSGKSSGFLGLPFWVWAIALTLLLVLIVKKAKAADPGRQIGTTPAAAPTPSQPSKTSLTEIKKVEYAIRAAKKAGGLQGIFNSFFKPAV